MRVVAVGALVVLSRAVIQHDENGHTAEAVAPSPIPADPSPVARMDPSEGPRQVAARILTTYASYTTRPAEGAEASLRSLASESAADGLVATLRADLARLATGYPGGQTRLWTGILASRLWATATEARVELWFCRVVEPPGKAVYSEWRMAVVDLAWERDAWRLQRFEESDGPRPADLPGEPTGRDEHATALTGFEAVEP